MSTVKVSTCTVLCAGSILVIFVEQNDFFGDRRIVQGSQPRNQERHEKSKDGLD